MARLTLFKIGFLPITIIDVLDVLAVAFILYRIFMLVRGTRAAQMILGLLVLFIAGAIAEGLRMGSLSWLLSLFKTMWLFALIILFQPELRRMLIRLGQSRPLRFLFRAERGRLLDEVVGAARMLSERGYGGLIVLVRDVGIASIIETGVKLQAEVSSALITSIFVPLSPLHDGALIIQGDMVVGAKCLLPLSQNPNIDQSMGTRHRAALGLSEESDAVVIVVSEETREISLAVGGEMDRDLQPADLEERLEILLGRR